jgi:hypothetical protein
MSEAASILRALGGRAHGRGSLCCCPAHADRDPSLSVSEGRDGRLLLHCFAGCDFRDVLASLRGLGLVTGDGRAFAPDPEAEARRAAEDEADRLRRVAQARRAWAEAQPIAGTLAERYLREGRAIRAPLAPWLRFHPEAWHKPTARRYPAMVAAVVLEGAAEPVAVHRTYLAEPGRKAAVPTNKAMLGPAKGGAVRLSEGPGPLVVAEGLETALSLLDALAGHRPRVWAALSANGMKGLTLPAEPEELVAAPDPDRTGWDAAEALANRAHGQGWRVRILPPPGDGIDWNAAAMGRAAA